MNIKKCNDKFNTHSKIIDVLYDASIEGVLPATINSDNVEWIFTMPNGEKWGITNAMAQAIKIKCSNRYNEDGYYMPYGGSLDFVKGKNFNKYNKNFKNPNHIDL